MSKGIRFSKFTTVYDPAKCKLPVRARFDRAAGEALVATLPEISRGRGISMGCVRPSDLFIRFSVVYRPEADFGLTLQMRHKYWGAWVESLLSSDRHQIDGARVQGLTEARDYLVGATGYTLMLNLSLSPGFGQVKSFAFEARDRHSPTQIFGASGIDVRSFADCYSLELWPASVVCDGFIVMALHWLTTSRHIPTGRMNREQSELWKSFLLGEDALSYDGFPNLDMDSLW